MREVRMVEYPSGWKIDITTSTTTLPEGPFPGPGRSTTTESDVKPSLEAALAWVDEKVGQK